MIKRLVIGSISLLVLVIAGLAVYVYGLKPTVKPAASVQVPLDPAVIERGRYLAENVVLCSDCHSERDWRFYGGPRKDPTGIGRECITEDTPAQGVITAEDDDIGVVSEDTRIGTLCIPNLTPHMTAGIGSWTDGEVIRAMREGVDNEGNGLFPIMPYFIFRNIADEDAKAIVAYLRSLEPVDIKRPEKDITFPISLLMQLWPEPVHESVPLPDASDTVAYGKYLAEIARCEFCHTPRTRFGRGLIEEMRFSGGVPFHINDLLLYSNNLTPDPETGIGKWSREKFIAFFKQHSEKKLVDPDNNTLMNWNAYAGMTEADIGAIYDYLQTVPPIDNAKRDRAILESTF